MAAHGHGQLRRRHGDGGVAGTLGQAGTHAQAPGTVRKTLRVVDRTALGILGIRVGIVVTVDVTAVITTGREIDGCRERRVGIELRILRVSPLDAEVLPYRIIRQTLLACHVVTVVNCDVSGEPIAPYIFGFGTYCPGTAGVDVTRYLQIDIIAQREVISQVAQIKTAGVVITEIRHDQTAGVFVREGEESERDGKW